MIPKDQECLYQAHEYGVYFSAAESKNERKKNFNEKCVIHASNVNKHSIKLMFKRKAKIMRAVYKIILYMQSLNH